MSSQMATGGNVTGLEPENVTGELEDVRTEVHTELLEIESDRKCDLLDGHDWRPAGIVKDLRGNYIAALCPCGAQRAFPLEPYRP